MIARILLATALLMSCSAGSRESKHVTDLPVASPVEAEAAAESWEIDSSRLPRAYAADGIRVQVVPVRSTVHPELTERYLVRAQGTEDDLDGAALITWLKEWHPGKSLTGVVGGEPQAVIYYRDSHHDRGWRYAHGNPRAAPARLVQEDISAAEALALLQVHREQRASGMLDKLAPESREGRERAQDARFEPTVKEVKDACGALSIGIDWSSVDERAFEELSVSSVCSELSRAFTTFCAFHPNTLPAIQKLSGLRCQLQGDPKKYEGPPLARRDDGSMSFTPGPSGPTVERTYSQLRDLFGEGDQVLRAENKYFILKLKGQDFAIYYGDGKTFYPNGHISPRTYGNDAGLQSGGTRATLGATAGRWRLGCDDQVQELKTIVGAERDTILAGASFAAEPKWKREPYFLSRDTLGIYYYVDRFEAAFGGKRYRVFIGRRGQLKLSKLKGVVEDSEGTVFSTDKGDLRLVVNPQGGTASWIHGKTETPLTPVNIYKNRQLIYDELGVYFGEDLGLVCDI